MAIITANLAPNGLAYVSFNANPGGYFRRMLRDVGRWHARGLPTELETAAKGQELFHFLMEQRVSDADTYGALLAREVPPLAELPLEHLVHDDFGEFWDALWFFEFADDAARHGLTYIGEADLSGLRGDMLPEGVDEHVWTLARGDRVAFETYSDLLIARHFRQSVLCRTGIEVSREPAPAHAARLYWAVRPNSEPMEVSLVADTFAELDRRAPHAVPFEELREALGVGAQELGEALLDGFRRERMYPHAGPLLAARDPGERPVASPLARWQARRAPDLTSLAYQTVRMEEPAARLLVAMLDGTRDRAAIRAELAAATGLELSAEDLDQQPARARAAVPTDVSRWRGRRRP